MNARLTSIGFYITCITFFGFQSKPLIHANNIFSSPTVADHNIKTVNDKSSPKVVEEFSIKNIKQNSKRTSQKLIAEW